MQVKAAREEIPQEGDRYDAGDETVEGGQDPRPFLELFGILPRQVGVREEME